MKYRGLTERDDRYIAEIIRKNLRKHGLDIPGTVYFDDSLKHLSDFYLKDADKRFYLILEDDEGNISGGVGLAEFPYFPSCAELQKLYLSDHVKGKGLGYELIKRIEDKAVELGYERIYLETHDNLQAAIHEYEKSGFKEIDRPEGVVHGAMNRFFMKEL